MLKEEKGIKGYQHQVIEEGLNFGHKNNRASPKRPVVKSKVVKKGLMMFLSVKVDMYEN